MVEWLNPLKGLVLSLSLPWRTQENDWLESIWIQSTSIMGIWLDQADMLKEFKEELKQTHVSQGQIPADKNVKYTVIIFGDKFPNLFGQASQRLATPHKLNKKR